MSDYAAGNAPVLRSSSPEPTYHGQKDRSANRAVRVRVRGLGQEIMLRLPPEKVREALQNPDIIKAGLDQKFTEYRNFVDTVYDGLEPHEKAALQTSPVPILGDAVGIYSDALNYIQDPDSRTLANGLLTAASALPLIPNASQVRAANKVRKNLQAWHGSPHRFDKFSLSRIGTGEGAQAYGHGLYFAESQDVAEQYAGMSMRHPVQPDSAHIAAAKDFIANNMDPADGLKTAYPQASTEEIQAAIIEAGGGFSPNLYKASINADPETMLDWDAPLSEQSESVRNALAPIREQVRKSFPEYADNDEITGQGLYQMLRNHRGGSSETASLALREAGIPGIRYFDGNSRARVGADQLGTRNYVIFDDSLVDIVERNGEQIQGVSGNSGLLDQE